MLAITIDALSTIASTADSQPFCVIKSKQTNDKKKIIERLQHDSDNNYNNNCNYISIAVTLNVPIITYIKIIELEIVLDLEYAC